MTDLDWIFNKLPRGEDLPIACTYEFSKGKSGPEQSDLPEGWKLAGHDVAPEDVIAAGWPEQVGWLQGQAQAQGMTFIYLRNAEDEIVATWDEGRWWTPDESAAFALMGTTPGAFAIAEQNEISKLPRAMRRKLGYK
jgi:hypothetical protein